MYGPSLRRNCNLVHVVALPQLESCVTILQVVGSNLVLRGYLPSTVLLFDHSPHYERDCVSHNIMVFPDFSTSPADSSHQTPIGAWWLLYNCIVSVSVSYRLLGRVTLRLNNEKVNNQDSLIVHLAWSLYIVNRYNNIYIHSTQLSSISYFSLCFWL